MSRSAMRRAPGFGYGPGLICVLAIVLVIIIIFAGVDGRITGLYFLKTDASKLSIPPKLDGSDILKGISQVSGGDFVGQPATASSLGIADSYTIHLLTACAHFRDGPVSCSKPSIGFAFNPGSNMRLDSTSLQGTYSDDLLSALSRYSKSSRYIAGAYIVSAALLLITIAANCFSALVGAVTSSIAAIVLFSVTIATSVMFSNLNRAFNANFHDKNGLHSKFSKESTAISAVAFVAALAGAIVCIGCARRVARNRRTAVHHVGSKTRGDALLAGGEEDPYAAPGGGKGGAANKKGGGFLARVVPVLPGQKHKYVQVEDSDHPALMRTDADGRTREVEDDWAGGDEYSQPLGNIGRSSPSVPLVSMGGSNKPTRDMNTAYEPYGSQGTGPDVDWGVVGAQAGAAQVDGK